MSPKLALRNSKALRSTCSTLALVLHDTALAAMALLAEWAASRRTCGGVTHSLSGPPHFPKICVDAALQNPSCHKAQGV